MATKDPGKYKYLMAFGHFFSDINQGALAAVLPFLIAAYHYDYATAATLVLLSNLIGAPSCSRSSGSSPIDRTAPG